MQSRNFRLNTAILVIFILLSSSCTSVNKHNAKQKAYLVQSGVIRKNTVWSGNIRLQDNILVPRGVTLTLQAGCTVTVSEKPRFRLEPMFISEKTEILVLGSLNIAGQKGREVSLSGVSEHGRGWAGIIMSGNDASVSTEHAILKDADVGIYVLAGRAVINNTKFTNNKTGLLVQGGENFVSNSLFVNNKRGMAAFGGKTTATEINIQHNKTGILGGKNIKFIKSSVTKNTVNFQ